MYYTIRVTSVIICSSTITTPSFTEISHFQLCDPTNMQIYITIRNH